MQTLQFQITYRDNAFGEMSLSMTNSAGKCCMNHFSTKGLSAIKVLHTMTLLRCGIMSIMSWKIGIKVQLENKRWDFSFAHLWCHNGWASNISIMPVSTTHVLFSFLVRIVLLLHFTGGIYLSNYLHHFIDFIWIITPLMKINVLIQETKIIVWSSSHV